MTPSEQTRARRMQMLAAVHAAVHGNGKAIAAARPHAGARACAGRRKPPPANIGELIPQSVKPKPPRPVSKPRPASKPPLQAKAAPLSLEDSIARNWSHDPKLRAEFFDSFASYAAWRRAEAEGRARIVGA